MTVVRTLAVLAFMGWFAVAATPMEFTTVARGDQSDIDEPRQAVARTAAEWATLWKQHAGADAPPSVDFARSMVIGVFAGSRPTAGYGVEITLVEKLDTGIVVTYHEQRPAPDQIVAQVLTAPFHIVRTQRGQGPITFHRTP